MIGAACFGLPLFEQRAWKTVTPGNESKLSYVFLYKQNKQEVVTSAPLHIYCM